MGRKPGLDQKKVVMILSVLIRNPDGIWLRKIAKETGLHPSTVGKYVDSILSPLVDDNSLGDSKPFLRVIKLKPFIMQKLQEGMDIKQILKLIRITEKIGNH
ncbi:hypothetical protein ACFLQN_02945 [Candidatus Aenigmatarchaeota archaeon]